ncbi:hypothetical protein SCUCBS95973_004300 [Sporothrix curviconia]|uniref:Zn(2)-C6 fungal-type domain-containing protein n=1 Tax=Sporothrix curviconia TaxID=1260050 RepID=A0ABP0BML6_9PEZI
MNGDGMPPVYEQALGSRSASGFSPSFPPISVPVSSATPRSADSSQNGPTSTPSTGASTPATTKKKPRRNADPSAQKRRCVSTACVACRKRKSKCDGALPSCAACASVYCTECVYDPNSDHRRKGVYREKVDSMKAQNSTLQILIEAILNAAEDDVPAIVKKIRTCDSLDAVAESFVKDDFNDQAGDNQDAGTVADNVSLDPNLPAEGEFDLARKMGELRLENGSVRFIGGTSHLIYIGDSLGDNEPDSSPDNSDGGALAARAESQFEAPYTTTEEAINSWTTVTSDTSLIIHLLNMYFNWHYTYFTTLSKSLFYRDFLRGRPQVQPKRTVYCTSLLVNAMLSLGCHFTGATGSFAVPGDSRTKGDHFFAEAKRLIVENDEYEKPKLATVQALALMSVREAGCAREAKGWVYSGMSFRMAQDIGLNFDAGSGAGLAAGASESDTHHPQMSEGEIDARRITFWGCFLFDKAWSNYLGLELKKLSELHRRLEDWLYMIHSACTIHLLNLPEKTAKRNIIHGVKQLEEIAEDWLCARRTLSIISVLARKWGVELPEEASQVLQRSDKKYGTFNTADVPSPILPTGPRVGNPGSNNSPHQSQDFGNYEAQGTGNSSTASLQSAVVKSEQFGPGGLAITAMPGLLEQYSQQSPAFQDFSTPGVTPEYLSGLAKVASPTASGSQPSSKLNTLPPGIAAT